MNAFLLTLLLSSAVVGQCSSSGCGPNHSYVIKRYMVQFEGLNLTVEGYWCPERGTIIWNPNREFNRRAISVARALANAVDAPLVAPVKPIQNFGLDVSRIGQHAYTNASPEAKRFIAESRSHAGADGPAAKLHLTVIGSDADRGQLMRDLDAHPAFASLKGHLMVQDYRPDEWAVDPTLGFQTAGKPAILLQTAKGPGDPRGGRVVYRALDYTMGPEALSRSIDAEARKVDPNYSPARDPGPAAGNGGDLVPGLTNDHLLYGAIIVVVLILCLKLPRKEG